MNIRALINTLSSRARTLPVVILYVTEGCNLRCITCSYREAAPGELSISEIEDLGSGLAKLGLRHIVFSGGEPLLRKDFPQICRLFTPLAASRTLLTNGLLLAKRADEIADSLTEIIVSIDGPDAHTHDAIRGGESFAVIAAGVRTLTGRPKKPRVGIRTVVQKKNFRDMFRMVDLAHDLGADRVSFLAADLSSEGFGREERGPAAPDAQVLLSRSETAELRDLLRTAAPAYAKDFASGFISESPFRLGRIAAYYEALLGIGPLPRNRCNAPMVSAVIGARGEIRPCFFLPSYGSVRKNSVSRLLNDASICRTRRDVRDYVPERCHTCVCTLHMSPLRALRGRF